ncbi:unnamed protein product [Diamesa hyperborea]
MIGIAKFVIGSFLVLLSVQQGYSIQCYNCTSLTQKDCGDVTKLDQFIINCTGLKSPVEGGNQTSTFCRNVLQTIDFKQNGMETGPRIIRSCGFVEGESKNQCIRRVNSGIVLKTCDCDQDKCNSANSITSTVLVMTSVLLLVFKCF